MPTGGLPGAAGHHGTNGQGSGAPVVTRSRREPRPLFGTPGRPHGSAATRHGVGRGPDRPGRGSRPAGEPSAPARAESFASAERFVANLEAGSARRLLSAGEQARLARIIRACGLGDPPLHGFATADPSRAAELGRRAVRVFEERNLRLVHWIAVGYAGGGVDVEDLIQDGWFGLRRAVEKFDPEQGTKFSTYAVWWIRQAVERALASTSRLIRLPVHVDERIRKVVRTREQLLTATGRAPLGEVARRTGLDPGEVRRLLGLARGALSLDAPVGDGRNALGEVLPADTGIDEVIERGVVGREVGRIVDRLPPRDREVLRRRFGLGGAPTGTLEEIGRTLGVTRERVRQVEVAALRRLREGADGPNLRSLLVG